LLILAFLTIVGGYVGLPQALGGGNWFENFLEPVFAGEHQVAGEAANNSHSLEYLLMLASIVAAAIGIFGAYRFYIANPEKPKRLAEKFKGIYNTLLNKYYVDEFYNAVVVQPLITLGLFFWKITDLRGIDAIANGLAQSFGWMSSKIRFAQTGLVRNYALLFVIGVIFLIGFVFFR
jgi:NADH-quinone oxidoreductase subunit L